MIMGFRLDTAYEELLNQFQDAPGILSFLEAVFNRVEDTDQLLADLLLKRDLETAEGVWLDIIGAIVGYGRPAEYILDDNIFTFVDQSTDPSDPAKSFADDSPATYGGYFQDLDGVHPANAELVGDDDYRVLIKAKIAATNSAPSLPAIGRFISESFGIGFAIAVPVAGYIVIELDAGTEPIVRFAIRKFAPVMGGVDLYVV